MRLFREYWHLHIAAYMKKRGPIWTSGSAAGASWKKETFCGSLGIMDAMHPLLWFFEDMEDAV